MKSSSTVLVLLLLTLVSRAEAAEERCTSARQRVVVVGIQSNDEAVRGLLAGLNDEYATALHSTGCYDILAVSDISLSLQFDGLKAEFGCNDEACRAKLDKELQRADVIAAGELRATSEGHQLSLIFLDAVSRQSVKRYGPTPPTKSEVAHRNEVRKGVRVLAGLAPNIRTSGNMLAVLTVRDPSNKLEIARKENLTTVLYVELAQSPLLTLVPRDRVVLLEAQLRDPARVGQEARARYLLETELLVFSEHSCGVAATLYDLEHGVTRLATRVRGACAHAELADAMEVLARQIVEILTPQAKNHWQAWVSAGAAVTAGTVGAIFLAGAAADVEARNAAGTSEGFRAADSDAREKALVSSIGFGVAGAAVAAGLTYLVIELLSGDEDADPSGRLPPGDTGAIVRF
jgi:hypothetical protein